jgi:hypothetical protein
MIYNAPRNKILITERAFMKQKWILSLSVLSLAVGAQLLSLRAEAQVVGTLGDILRDANGRVRRMNQYDAERTCREQGTRLPTARELAVYSQSLGARGIRETAHPGVVTWDTTVRAEIEQMDRDGYYPIYVANSSGQRAVDFYFNYSGYQRPAGDLGNLWFWSSSVRPVASNYADVLNGSNGYVDYVNRSYGNDNFAVRCVR